jgi:hypothetical protein
MQDVSVGKASSAVLLAIVIAALALPVAQAKPRPVYGVGDNMSTYSSAAKAKAHKAKPRLVYGIGDNMSLVAPANRARANAHIASVRGSRAVALTFYAGPRLTVNSDKPTLVIPYLSHGKGVDLSQFGGAKGKPKAKTGSVALPYDPSDVISRLLARLGHTRPNDRPTGTMLWNRWLVLR